MAKTEIKIGGFGGQGVILTGYIIGKAASIFDGKDATMTQAFGPRPGGAPAAPRSSSPTAPSAILTSRSRRSWSS